MQAVQGRRHPVPQYLLDTLPRWARLTIGLLLVAVIGYVDYLTEDYSILIFYLVPVSFVSWYNGRMSGVIIGLASGVARIVSDTNLYRNILQHSWNSLQDMVFLLIVGLLVSLLRQELGRDEEG
jgi:uncharacterized protein DUF4118